MKYQKIIVLLKEDLERIESGEIILQRGQWVKLHWALTPSRWVGVAPSKSLWIVHTNSKKGFSTVCKRFKQL